MLFGNIALGFFALGASALSIAPHESLAGRSDAEIEAFARSVYAQGASPLPPPIKDTSAKLVADAKHPFIPPTRGQARGPCPGMNTLANHGYLPRSGIATPQQIITASQEGFGMGYDLSSFVTFANMLVNGNHVSNLMSIGSFSPATGHAPPAPATAGGLSTHNTFEGDASLTRLDAHFGSNVDFNEGLFQQFLATGNRVGNGTINLVSAGQHRADRVHQSRDTNPDFFYDFPRFPVSFAEAAFTISMFVDGRTGNSETLDYVSARTFFQSNHYPEGFHRRDGPLTIASLADITNVMVSAHPDVVPGINQRNPDGTFTFIQDTDPLQGQTDANCAVYLRFVNKTETLYPNPKGALRTALKQNLVTFYSPISTLGCTQVFPYGK